MNIQKYCQKFELPTMSLLNYYTKINNGSSWTAIILTFCHPSEIRLYEQLAIYLFNPKLNSIKNISVNTRYNTEDLTSAPAVVHNRGGQCNTNS